MTPTSLMLRLDLGKIRRDVLRGEKRKKFFIFSCLATKRKVEERRLLVGPNPKSFISLSVKKTMEEKKHERGDCGWSVVSMGTCLVNRKSLFSFYSLCLSHKNKWLENSTFLSLILLPYLF